MSTSEHPSLHSVRAEGTVDDVVTALEGALQAAGMKLFARIDHADEARAVGLTLRPTVLLVFGNPKVGTPLMQARATVALDLPMKALVFQDEAGQTWLTYNTAVLLSERHGLASELAAKQDAAAELLVRALDRVARR